MNNYIDQLRDWAVSRHKRGVLEPELRYFENFYDKRSCWITFRSSSGMGQFMVWESGEYQIEIGSTTEINDVLSRSGVLISGDHLVDELNAALDFMQQPSAQESPH